MAASTVMFRSGLLAKMAAHERTVVWLLAVCTDVLRRLVVVDKVKTAQAGRICLFMFGSIVGWQAEGIGHP